jgi:hypothetical protein
MKLQTMAANLGLRAATACKQIFQAYKEALCPEPLAKADFVRGGADPAGKTDYQGCGELDPLYGASAFTRSEQPVFCARRVGLATGSERARTYTRPEALFTPVADLQVARSNFRTLRRAAAKPELQKPDSFKKRQKNVSPTFGSSPPKTTN